LINGNSKVVRYIVLSEIGNAVFRIHLGPSAFAFATFARPASRCPALILVLREAESCDFRCFHLDVQTDRGSAIGLGQGIGIGIHSISSLLETLCEWKKLTTDCQQVIDVPEIELEKYTIVAHQMIG
jgi:hypothetical protein